MSRRTQPAGWTTVLPVREGLWLAAYTAALTVLRRRTDFLEDFQPVHIGTRGCFEPGDIGPHRQSDVRRKESAGNNASAAGGWTSGDPTEKMLSQGGKRSKGRSGFNSMAMELGFGDGLPLIMPLPELVDEMLAATTRSRDDVIGKVMPRGGIITVEKVAINSVMAGARPEYFPAILAAMEAYATSWEDPNLLYHALTSSDNYSLMLLFSGPIVEELGISGQWGQLSSGNEANNAIGRAVRLSIRNIGLNRTNVTDGTANRSSKRPCPHGVREEERLLPEGWGAITKGWASTAAKAP